MMEDNEGNTWFASFGQGAIMFGDEKFLSYGQVEGLIGSQVLSVLFDSDDIFYVATEEGFICFRNEDGRIRRLNFFTSGNGLNDMGANSIIKKDNQIWIGTNNGINIFDGSKISKFPENSRLPDRKINCLLADRKNNIWIGTNGGYCKLSGNNLFFLSQEEGLIHDEVQTIIEDKKGRIWMGTLGGLVRLEGETYTDFNTEDGLSFLRINCLAEDPAENIWIGTFGGGIFKFENSSDTVPISVIATKGMLSSNTINSLLFINDTLLVAGTDKGFDLVEINKNQSITNVIHFGLNDGFTGGENNVNSITRDKDGLIWFGTKNGLVKFNPGIDMNYHSEPRASITGLKLFFEEVDWKQKGFELSKWSGLPEDLVLSHKDNHLTFEVTGFSFHNPEDLMFSYYLEPQSKEWAPYSSIREIQFPGLTPGSYSFKVKARNKYGTVGKMAEFKFIIKPPFWQTTWFIISSSFILLIMIIIFVRLRVRNLIMEKIKLENIVEERTREVVEQKDEIARQRDVVTYQKKEITDSIHYAERIQQAVLPEEKILKKTFSDYFIILRPKDIVSGDFYWMTEKNNHVVFTAADCTGHGVPGALMSMLGVSFLNKIVNESGIVKPSAILTSLRENIISALKQEGSLKASKDGMDIALCSVDMKKMKLWFSGANNPLYIVRKEKNEYVFIEKKGDRMPIGYYSIMTDFTNHELDIQKGDTIYLFSDGFIDQFGGPEGRKFMVPRFKQILLDNQELDMASQREIFIKILDEWIKFPSVHNNHSDQVDDIILLGIRI
jgi:serine phosphatase RsbU (regulator of sigma subunit)